MRSACLGPACRRGSVPGAKEVGEEIGGEGACRLLCRVVVQRGGASALRGVNGSLMRRSGSCPRRVRRGLRRCGAIPPLGCRLLLPVCGRSTMGAVVSRGEVRPGAADAWRMDE